MSYSFDRSFSENGKETYISGKRRDMNRRSCILTDNVELQAIVLRIPRKVDPAKAHAANALEKPRLPMTRTLYSGSEHMVHFYWRGIMVSRGEAR